LAPLLPAATTKVTPRLVAFWIAVRMMLVLLPPRLMFATLMLREVALLATQSMPQMICDQAPEPCELSTFTAMTWVPGATPTTPLPLFRAPIVPATWVPWP
jgi:hypothetical protein